MMLSRLLGALAGAAVVLSAGAALAKKPKPACGITYLPMVEGTTWRYEFAVPPEVTEAPGPRTLPPESLEIEVVKIETRGKKTLVHLAERYRDVVVETTLSCSKDGLEVPVESFFFAGEPGGGRGFVLANVEAKGELYPGKSGLSRGASLYVAVKADVTREPAPESGAEHVPAKLEIERMLNVGGRESIESGVGILGTTKVEIVISGRAAVEPELDKPVNMPETRSEMWFANGVGLIRAYNRLGHGWALAEVKTASDAD